MTLTCILRAQRAGAALNLSSLAACASLLAACAVGPNFKKPAAPEAAGYTPTPLSTTVATANVSAGDAQRFVTGSDISADWWTLFHSAPLNELIDLSLANNHDFKAAQAALSVARENVLAQRGVYYPSVAASFSATRQRQSGQIAPTLNSNAFLYDLFTPQVSISYVPDVFGLNRRTVESLQAQEQEVRFQMIATYTTLTANVVVTAIQSASLQMQIDATRQLIDSNAVTLKILQYQFDEGLRQPARCGGAGIAARANDRHPAAAGQATGPVARSCWRSLTGRFPSQATAEQFELSSLQLPQDLPVSLPSALVAQRPDVLQAEANLHDASAKIGIADGQPAAEYRTDRQRRQFGCGHRASCSRAGTGFWGLGAEVTAPIFQGGTLLHQERAAKAAYVQAAEQYRSTVLTAFQNVADTLTALEQDAEAVKAAAAAADAAKITLDLAQRQWQDGYAGYLALLSAEQADQADPDQLGAGPGQSLCRHGGAVSGAGRRLVASRGSRHG